MGISWEYHGISWNTLNWDYCVESNSHTMGISWDISPDFMIFGCVWKWGTPTKINRDIMGKYLLPTMGIRNELQGLHLQESMAIFVDFFEKIITRWHRLGVPIECWLYGIANYSKLLVIARGYHQLVKSQDCLATHDLASGVGYPGYPQFKKVLVSWYTPISDSKCHQISWHIPLHHIYIYHIQSYPNYIPNKCINNNEIYLPIKFINKKYPH